MQQTLKVYGPTMHGRKWRVELREGDRRRYKSFESPADAARYAEKTRKSVASAGVTLDSCLDSWLVDLGRQNLSEGTRSLCWYRVAGMLKGHLDWSPVAVTPDVARKLYKALQDRWEVATHREALHVTRRFWRWLMTEKVAKTNPWVDIAPVGKANKGKTQLTVNECRQLIDYLLGCREQLALPVLTALMLGLRVGEVLSVTTRDVDDGGRLLHVTGKTGRRPVPVPLMLQGVLRARAERAQGGKLWPVKRNAVRVAVGRFCKAAGVTVVTTHALRGTHATLALLSGASAPEISALIGNSPVMLKEHYLAPGAVETANIESVSKTLFPNENAPLEP
jgi:integrase